jgi:SAM-dependent methyltransferase
LSNSLAEVYRAVAQSKFNQSIGGGDPGEVGARQSDILIALDRMSEADTILDYGCGIGRTMPALLAKLANPVARLDGCDISEDFLEECKLLYRQFDFRFFKISAENEHYEKFRTTSVAEPMPKNYYDYAYSFSVFTHFDLAMSSKTLTFIKDLLKISGRYYFTMFRIDDQSKPVIAQNASPAFKFQAPYNEHEKEYFAIPSDKFAFAAMAQDSIEYEIARSGFKTLMFHPGAWRGISAGNIHDGYLIEKL